MGTGRAGPPVAPRRQCQGWGVAGLGTGFPPVTTRCQWRVTWAGLRHDGRSGDDFRRLISSLPTVLPTTQPSAGLPFGSSGPQGDKGTHVARATCEVPRQRHGSARWPRRTCRVSSWTATLASRISQTPSCSMCYVSASPPAKSGCCDRVAC